MKVSSSAVIVLAYLLKFHPLLKNSEYFDPLIGVKFLVRCSSSRIDSLVQGSAWLCGLNADRSVPHLPTSMELYEAMGIYYH